MQQVHNINSSLLNRIASKFSLFFVEDFSVRNGSDGNAFYQYVKNNCVLVAIYRFFEASS